MWQPPLLLRNLEASIRDLRDPSPTVRVAAVRDLAQHLDEDRFRVVAGLRQMLADSHHDVRAVAAEMLGRFHVEECVDALVRCVCDSHVFPAQMALDALAELGTPEALEPVRNALMDERPELRFQAMMALPKYLDDAEADQVLSAGIQDRDAHVRYIAVRVAEERWSGATVAPKVDQAARKALQDRDDDVRIAAALLLASWKDREGASILLEVVTGSLRPRELQDEVAVVEAVGTLGLHEAIPALERRAYGVGRFLKEQCTFYARVSLARLGHPRAKADLLGGLKSWTRIGRDEAIVAVGKARLEEARGVLEGLRDRPGRVDAELVREALEALGKSR